MNALAEYALIAQQNNMVPIVEPEVIMDGSHSVERCHEVTKQALLILFEMLDKKKVNIKGTLLKPNMVVSGTENSYQATIQELSLIHI